MILLWGAELIQIYNDAYSIIMGKKHPAGMGQPTSQCWPEVWAFNEPIYQRVLEGETLKFEDQLFPITRHRFQENAYFTLCYSPLRENGDISGVLVSVFETTTEIKSEIARKQTDHDLRTMVDSTPQMSWAADEHGTIVDFSKRWIDIAGEKTEYGQLHAWMRDVLAEDLPQLRSAWLHAVATGESFDCEHRIRSVSGELCWMRSRAHPARNDRGHIVRWYGTTEDIHDRKVAEHALRASEERLREVAQQAEKQWAELETVYRTAPIGLALFDTEEFRYLRLNDLQASFFGLKPEQVLGKTLTEMAPIEGLADLFRRVLKGEPVINYPLEGTLVNDPERYRYWTVNYFPIFAPDGTIQAITAASLEITAQKKAELALLQTEKLAAVGRLAASIAHEINNPLESVTNLLYLARQSNDAAELEGYLETAERELRRVSVITNQTLRFHKQSSNPVEVDCRALIESALSIFQGKIVNSSVHVEKRLSPCTPVECFDGEIRQVLSNLIANAIDAMHPDGGRLLLRSRNSVNRRSGERGIALTIADTGGGMPLRVQEKIFDAFYTTKGAAGTGLGLWVSKEIVDRHRGSLRVRSSQSSFANGTVFRMFLPLKCTHPHDQQHAGVHGTPMPAGTSAAPSERTDHSSPAGSKQLSRSHPPRERSR